MDEIGFKNFLENRVYKNEHYTSKSISSRMAKARKAEQILNCSFDLIVCDDNKMYDSLNELQKHENPAHNLMQNALRKYYIFKNKKEFPQLRDYKRR